MEEEGEGRERLEGGGMMADLVRGVGWGHRRGWSIIPSWFVLGSRCSGFTRHVRDVGRASVSPASALCQASRAYGLR